MAEDKNLESTESAEELGLPTDEAQANIDEETPAGDELAIEDLDAAAEPYQIAADETEAEELEGIDPTTSTADEPETDEMIGDEAQLEEAEAAAAAANSTRPKKRKQIRKEAEAAGAAVEEAAEIAVGARPTKKPEGKAPQKKTEATRKRSQAAADAEKKKAATPAQFVRESADELKKTVWPTGEQLRNYFAVVLAFVLFIIVFCWGLDTLFGWALLKWLA